MNKKVLFITPPYHCGVVEVAGRWIPLYLVYLAGAAKSVGFEPYIYDAMSKFTSHEEIEKKIKFISPEYVAVSAITSTINDSLEVLRRAKTANPEIVTILGGVHPTFMYEEILSKEDNQKIVDFIIYGEGEETLKELLLAIKKKLHLEKVNGIVYLKEGKIVKTNPRKYIEDLDALPLAYDLLDWNDYTYFIIPDSRLGAISTSRGCEKGCTFCSQQQFWNKSWRARSPESCVDEIAFLKESYGVNVVLITDEYPTKDAKRWEKFLDLIIKQNLDVKILMETRADDIVRDKKIIWKYRKAGIIHIYVGIESHEQEILDNKFKKEITNAQAKEALKLLHKHGIITETSFILGLPDENPASIRQTLLAAKEYNPDLPHFLAICPWPYSEIYNEVKDFIEDFNYSNYNLITPVMRTKHMSVKEIDDALIYCYKEFYMNKMKEVMKYKDEFKKDYMLTSFRLMMNSSFLKEKMKMKFPKLSNLAKIHGKMMDVSAS